MKDEKSVKKNLGMKATSMGVFMTKSRSIAFPAQQSSQLQMMADKVERTNENRNVIG